LGAFFPFGLAGKAVQCVHKERDKNERDDRIKREEQNFFKEISAHWKILSSIQPMILNGPTTMFLSALKVALTKYPATPPGYSLAFR